MYVVKSSRAKMPLSVQAPYYRVAVLQMQPGSGAPRMISPRAKGVVRIVRVWERVFAGRTERCAFRRAVAEAESLCATLNKEST